MNIIYDPAKNSANRAKHGVSLADAKAFEWDDALIRQDDRYAYGEVRMRAIGYIGPRLHVLVYTDRGNIRRIISLRRANKREERHYAEA
ncbi:BrnT family toxin [Castellaniella hirudinis]|uniref:BrnT family toxin n=1 Tax=Castellaniella hirudinis TaxID=1144617 RepID=A0ABV8S2N1_9BURK